MAFVKEYGLHSHGTRFSGLTGEFDWVGHAMRCFRHDRLSWLWVGVGARDDG
jgi:hypothetical protein